MTDERTSYPNSEDPAAPVLPGGAMYRWSLTELVSVDVLQEMQNRFAALGQVSVAIFSVDGELITRPTWGSRFSEMVGTSPIGSRELAREVIGLAHNPNQRPARTCLHGMTLYDAPIRHEGRLLAHIVVGTRDPVWPPADQIRATALAYELDPDVAVSATKELRANIGGTPEAAHRFADGLADTVATLYEQALRIRRQLADLSTVHELADLLSRAVDVQRILDLTVRRVVEVLPVKSCGIRLLDERTGELVIKAVANLSAEYLQKGPLLLKDSKIDGAAFAGQTVYIEDAATDPRIRYPANARREGLVSGVCVPMAHRGKTVGVLRVYTGQRYVFPESEQALLRSIGSQAAAAIISSRLYEEKAEADRVRLQLDAAAEIQRRMLPARCPKHGRLSFGAVYVPTLQVGGDFYDFIELPSGTLGICIADVVGHGYAAALMASSVRSALRSAAYAGDDLATIMQQVNRHLCRDTQVGEFATLVYAVARENGSFRYCNAGHIPPLLLRDDECVPLYTDGMVIGVAPEMTFDVGHVALRPGDCLVLVTDGVTEAMNFHDEMYGMDRLAASLQRHKALTAEQLALQLLWDMRRFIGLAEQTDDVTIVVAKAR